MALLETHDLTAFYGDFQALVGISIIVESGETVAHHRRQRRRQVDVPEDARRSCTQFSRHHPFRRG
jgi:hypothetical protein